MAVQNGIATNGHSSKLPEKTRELTNHHMDSSIWNDVKFRPDDVVVATYAKSGTTWTQQIVTQLISEGDPTIGVGTTSPWVDIRVIPREAMLGMMESQTHRRCLKTHLPRDAMVWNPDIKYIFVGRDGRDAVWSAHNHFKSANAQFYELFSTGPPFDGPKLVRPSDDPRDLFQELLDDETSGKQLWPFWSHIRSWWETRDQPNMLFLHYNDLKADLNGEMRKVAKFLDIPEMSEEKWNACVEHCTFDWMKKNADLAAPPQAADVFAEGAQSFIYKGTNSRWKDVLTEEESKAYEERAKKELGEECATWLQYGSKKQ